MTHADAKPRPARSWLTRISLWRQRSVRTAVGVALLCAIGLLWPFADWSLWPMVAGLGVLVVLYLTRLNRLLFGWAPHLAGLVTVVLLAARSDPWAWGFAAGIAVAGVGLSRLPRRRVLVTGLVLIAIFGTGYAVSHYRTESELRAEREQAAKTQGTNIMAISPHLLYLSLANSVAGADSRTACALLGPEVAPQFAASVGAPDCAAAIARLAGQVVNPAAYRSARLPESAVSTPGDTATVDACQARWSTPQPAGPLLGRFELRRYQGGDRYLVVGYTPCR